MNPADEARLDWAEDGPTEEDVAEEEFDRMMDRAEPAEIVAVEKNEWPCPGCKLSQAFGEQHESWCPAR